MRVKRFDSKDSAECFHPFVATFLKLDFSSSGNPPSGKNPLIFRRMLSMRGTNKGPEKSSRVKMDQQFFANNPQNLNISFNFIIYWKIQHYGSKNRIFQIVFLIQELIL